MIIYPDIINDYKIFNISIKCDTRLDLPCYNLESFKSNFIIQMN